MNLIQKQRRSHLAVKIYGCCDKVLSYYGMKVPPQIFSQALAIEMLQQGMQVREKIRIATHYKGMELDETISIHFLIEDEIALEVCEGLYPTQWHEARLNTILFFSKLPMGILIDPTKDRIADGFKKIVQQKK
ncbi:MAG: GxxExxY protein [Bacteroidales bacterium]|nr:GxxExxY protein [Bacteroidales bacterium]MDD3701528.1 GxxExxY protein [Bacteroidales bacterium]MDY0369256.1 GxxExxY protein [Bacteroidales bacterium]